jgi:signal transduction histidine kinase
VLASLANSVALVDEDGRIVTCNPIFRNTFGGEAGQDIRDLGLSALAGPAVLPLEVRTGGKVFVASGRRLEGEWGGPASVIVLTDVTDLRRLQDEAGRREALAKIGSAVASINHEIMNVLTPVTMYLDAARRQCRTEEAKKALGAAQSRLAELKRLGDELRDYYREPELSPTAIRLADVVASCLGDLRVTAGDGWSPPRLNGLDLTLRADPQKLKQVLLNVLKNAWEAMAEASRRDWSVRARREDGRAVIEVRDSGAGLDPTAADRAFEPFYSTKKGSGAGLGLAIARRITEAHGGEIAVSGSDGPGAIATIAWPLTSDAGEGEGPVTRAADAEASC